MELRFPDPTCNPYLAFSVMLSAGLDGVDKKAPVPDPVSKDLYELTPVEREELDIASLPHDLYEAVQVAEHSEFLKDALGTHVHEKLMRPSSPRSTSSGSTSPIATCKST